MLTRVADAVDKYFTIAKDFYQNYLIIITVLYLYL